MQMRVGVIGGGLSGVVAAKELLSEGHDVVLFEKSDIFGGTFAHSYEILFTTSTCLSMFADFRPEHLDRNPKFFNAKEYVDYLSSYAEHFGVAKIVKFGHYVEEICWERSGSWKVVADVNSSKKEFHFDRICITTGSNFNPKDLGCLKEFQDFDGEIIHSVNFRTISNPVDIRNKRVLVIGGGESASDIMGLMAPHTSSLALSSRNGTGFLISRQTGVKPSDVDTSRYYHMIPRFLICFVVWLRNWLRAAISSDFTVDGDVLRYMLDTNNKLNERGLDWSHTFGTKNESLAVAVVKYGAKVFPGVLRTSGKRVYFIDGSDAEFDVVFGCIGFTQRFDFLKGDSLKVVAEEAACDIRNLFKNSIHRITREELFFCGFVRPNIGSVVISVQLQAKWFARLCSGKTSIACDAELEKIIVVDKKKLRKQFPKDRAKAWLRDFLVFNDEIAAMIGCSVPLIWLFFRHPIAWLKAFFGPITCAHYNLRGSKKEIQDAVESISRAPLGNLLNIACTLPLLVLCQIISWVIPSYSPVKIYSDDSGQYGTIPSCDISPNVFNNVKSIPFQEKDNGRTLIGASILIVFMFLCLIRWILK